MREDGRYYFDADISLTAAVSLDIKNSSGLTERELAEHIGLIVRRAWEKSEREGCDAVGVWRYLRQRFPGVYLERRDELPKLLSEVTPRIWVRCEIE